MRRSNRGEYLKEGEVKHIGVLGEGAVVGTSALKEGCIPWLSSEERTHHIACRSSAAPTRPTVQSTNELCVRRKNCSNTRRE